MPLKFGNMVINIKDNFCCSGRKYQAYRNVCSSPMENERQENVRISLGWLAFRNSPGMTK